MKSKFIKERINYSGEQLCSHFAYKNYDISGDSIISFIGACDVSDKMVDIADIKKKQFIHSDQMLHFIAEHFDTDLEKSIFRQRLLIAIIGESINVLRGKNAVKRYGNDLYSGKNKLSVSVATLSPVSSLIHVGLNITETGALVPIIGLKSLKIASVPFAQNIMKRYIDELEQIKFSKCKVKGVE